MLQKNTLEDILILVQQKHQLNLQELKKNRDNGYYKTFLESDHFFDAITHEVEEAKKENIPNNSIYLEDELGDILWDYMNLLYFLDQEGKISQENIFERCIKKYSERTEWLKNGILWNDVKYTQKENLEKEHRTKYSSHNL